MGRAQAVGSSVAASEDDDPLALRGDSVLRVDGLARNAAVLLGEVLHSQVNAVHFPARHGKLPGLAGADGEADCVEVSLQICSRDVVADVDAGLKDHALLSHDVDAALDDLLLHFEVGYAQSQEAANVLVALEQRNEVPSPVQLLRRGHARRP